VDITHAFAEFRWKSMWGPSYLIESCIWAISPVLNSKYLNTQIWFVGWSKVEMPSQSFRKTSKFSNLIGCTLEVYRPFLTPPLRASLRAGNSFWSDFNFALFNVCRCCQPWGQAFPPTCYHKKSALIEFHLSLPVPRLSVTRLTSVNQSSIRLHVSVSLFCFQS
jgi:hypothetical protein